MLPLRVTVVAQINEHTLELSQCSEVSVTKMFKNSFARTKGGLLNNNHLAQVLQQNVSRAFKNL